MVKVNSLSVWIALVAGMYTLLYSSVASIGWVVDMTKSYGIDPMVALLYYPPAILICLVVSSVLSTYVVIFILFLCDMINRFATGNNK